MLYVSHFWETLVEQKLLTLPEHLSSPPVFSGIRVSRSLILCFVDRYLPFCIFFFWLLCCLFFDIRILITPLVSPNFCFFWEALAWPHHCMEMRFWSIHFLNPVTFYALKCLYVYTTSVYMRALGIKLRFFSWISELLLKLIIPKYISIIIIIRSKV